MEHEDESAGEGRPAPAALAARVDAAVMAAWHDVWPGELGALGRRLSQRGLGERALVHGYGVTSPVHAPMQARMRRLADVRAVPPALVLAHLFVAGEGALVELVRARLGADLDRLVELGLVAILGESVWATVAILPVGEALVVSDRADVYRGADIALIADDSALHMIGAVRARAARDGLRWLDVGTGSGMVPLARPGAAARILGTDINARAVAMARLGAALSGIAHVELEVADLLDAGRGTRWDVITFNAPIPADDDDPVASEEPTYRRGEPGILERFWAGVRELAAADGEVIVHSRVPAGGPYPDILELPGQVVFARYTPDGMQPAFGVTWWRPGGPRECRHLAVALGPALPHITRAVLDDSQRTG